MNLKHSKLLPKTFYLLISAEIDVFKIHSLMILSTKSYCINGMFALLINLTWWFLLYILSRSAHRLSIGVDYTKHKTEKKWELIFCCAQWQIFYKMQRYFYIHVHTCICTKFNDRPTLVISLYVWEFAAERKSFFDWNNGFKGWHFAQLLRNRHARKRCLRWWKKVWGRLTRTKHYVIFVVVCL